MAKFKIIIPAGPLWNDEDAERKCPKICAAHLGKWTGKWYTPEETWGKMSVCECELDTDKTGSTEFVLDVLAGPIYSNDEAKEFCPAICASYGGEWTGNWHTPEETWNKMSVCQCKFKF